ncbi:MAG TPA: sigma-70 family RNA polymerase sigma factor [Pirellulales bacterium]|jgi:RNA polymerase sigma-70 factor (ECF subfamily)|nr:sigma-70 family RNA polymerase sigma factor [Pirellulales bacterium]
MEEAEEKLVAQIRLRDAEALGRYIQARRNQLLAYIERRLGGALRKKVEAEDMLQDLSAEAIRSLPVIDLAERDPFSWLCQLAERRIIDAHRRFFSSQKRDAGREMSIDAPAPGDSDGGGMVNLLIASMTTASQAFSRDVKQMRLMAAMSDLPEEAREALRLRYIENLPSKEIAQRLGKTDGAVRVLLTRSLAKLQHLLGVDAE